MSSKGEVTRLLDAVREGDPDALSALFPIVYAELRTLAHRQLAVHRRGTLSTTAVVHEAYLKLMAGQPVSAESRGHFFSLAARVMRQIVIDHARMRLAKKRNNPDAHGLLDGAELSVYERAEELLDLDRALERLSAADERLGRIVELRFFAGLSVEETADALSLSARTVKREWRKARALLHHELGGGPAQSA